MCEVASSGNHRAKADAGNCSSSALLEELHDSVSAEIPCEEVVHEDSIGSMCQRFLDELRDGLLSVKHNGGTSACRRNKVRDIGSEHIGGIVHHDEHASVENRTLCRNTGEPFVPQSLPETSEFCIDLLKEFCVRWEIVSRFHIEGNWGCSRRFVAI